MFNRDTMLHYHLQYNHYPPVPERVIPYAAAAIDLANDGDTELVIRLSFDDGSVGTLTRPDGSEVTVAELIEELHLEGFLEDPDG